MMLVIMVIDGDGSDGGGDDDHDGHLQPRTTVTNQKAHWVAKTP